jgi:FeS assembly SUF system protein
MGLKDWFKKKSAEIAEEEKENIMRLERDIIMALRQVYDPEIPVNVYDLGLIYEIRVNEEHEVYVQMTLTAPNCPMADYVVQQVKTAVEDVPGVVSAQIDLVWEPEWDKSRMSEEALVELGLDED